MLHTHIQLVAHSSHINYG